ncbi:hypothetical protein P280DRAFT_373512, partial [Massarina eburnea CBS 473.64]
PRPSAYRQRSNSVPIMEALGCSTPEAELILAEGRAAVHRRQASARRGRRAIADREDVYRPKDHLTFLVAEHSRKTREDAMSVESRKSIAHSRFPSDATDSSITTVVAATESPNTTAPSTLGNYSANLSKFIQAQLSSIPSYNTTQLPISPCSCPDLTYTSHTPPLSPTRSMRRVAEAPHVITIPPVRPPIQSAFSEWSSTDDDTDDERLPVPNSGSPGKNYTPSVLAYYENSNDSTFLFSSTPREEGEEDEDEEDPNTAKGFSFPNQSELPGSAADNPSPALLTHPQLIPSSTPSFAPVSAGEYFDSRLNPDLRARVIAAITPPQIPNKIIPAISPFDGAALSSVHNVLVESHHRVLVDGMSFDMLRDFNIP